MATLDTKIKGYESIYNEVSQAKQGIAANLIYEIKFMDTALSKLRTEIRKTGYIENFEQGKQKFLRENPALKAYNATVKQRNETYTKLLALLPRDKPDGKEKQSDGFEEFVEGRDD